MSRRKQILGTALTMVGAVSRAVGYRERVVAMPIIGKHKPTTNYYQKVYRVPDEQRKRTYSKIVTQKKADRLLTGKKMVRPDGSEITVPLKRKFVRA